MRDEGADLGRPAGRAMGRLETRELEYFVAVAEELHFGRAAERLGIAQPPLSRAIGRLERRMGVQLLRRTSRRVDLTAAGAVFLTESRKALTAVDIAVSRAQRSGRPHKLVVAARRGTGAELLAGVRRAYRRRPGAPEIEVVFTRDQAGLVRNGAADVALMCGHGGRGGLDGPDGLEFSEFTEAQTVVLLPADHLLADEPAVSVADVVKDELFRRLEPADAPTIAVDEIIDRVAMGELIVMMGVSATDRIGSAVVAVPVLDAPPTRLVLSWRGGVPAATREAFVRTAQSVAEGVWTPRETGARVRQATGVRVPQTKGPSWVAPPSTTSSKPVM
ncbi:LysR family transcriptional regulator [Streptomyces sp. NPDC047072]|uniref:LysR family transcriptional regulator n=1 Tax=Streptomyces sp. NPDC047072 TaxID=3154809 RepID=UPI0033DFEB86